MLHHLDAMIRELLGSRTGNGIDRDHVVFDPPDETLRSRVRGGDRMWLNAYLVELSENRRLRSVVPEAQPGGEIARPPVRIDCHYLISAWSPANPNPPAIEPTIDEHALLAAAIAVLVNADPFSALAVWAPNPVPAVFPAAFRDWDFPHATLPPDGYPKLSEFWLGMGQNQRLKPVIHFVATVPIAFLVAPAGPPVTSIRLSVAGEDTLSFGGRIRSLALPAPDGSPGPVADAFVELRTLAGLRLAATTSGPHGHYSFTNLSSGDYRVRAAHPQGGLQEIVLMLPSASGNFDVVLV